MISNKPVVLVTGGAGYIGSHACKALARDGFIPVTIDNLVCGNVWAVKWGPLEVGNILDRNFLDAVILKYRPIGVLHFAAFAYVGESVIDPGKYYYNNVVGSLSLLEAVRDHKIPYFVFSSTCATYGETTTGSISENHPQMPVNPYGASKLMIERILNDFQIAHKLATVSLRYFNAAGADLDLEVGESHDPETHLIPLVLNVAAGLKSEIEIYGDDYLTPDGTCLRDYIHVTDLARAHVLALNYLINGGVSAQFNLGTGKGHSVKEIIAHAERVTGKKIATTTRPRRLGDVPMLIAEVKTAKSILKWEPCNSSLETIIQTAWAWHKLNILNK